MDKDKLILYKLDLGDLGIIYSPIVEDVLNMGEEKFNRIMTPFIVDFDTFQVKKEDIEKSGLKKFDLFTYSENTEIPNSLINSLKYFYKTDKIVLIYDIITVNYKDGDIEKTIYINRDNFDELCEIILKLCNVEKSKEEKKKEVTIQNEENRAILEEYLRLQEQAKEEQEEMMKNNKITLLQIITVVAKDCNWDWDRALAMTYYRLILTYKSILKVDSYEIYLKYASSGQFKLENTQEHWTESIKKDL